MSMMPGMGGPGGPPPPQSTLGQGGKKKAGYNLQDIFAKETIKSYKKLAFILRPINRMYHLYQITTMFVKKGSWILSCMALMYGLPAMIEYMGEQNKIVMKIMAS